MQGKLLNKNLMVAILICVICLPISGTAVSMENPDFKAIVGEWVRPDGGYVIRVLNVLQNGTVDVGYFNPDPINVSEARVSLWKGLVKLVIKLQDKGYPGSTYTLYYYTEKDALAGFYYQAAVGQTYEVVFIRKPGR
ncbi:MAG: hypothetical protein DRH90_10650 [Deltaproteobacteria bacterium]|nr:MAG: hypothetical protein DRH90_10650 [Deltaproteobacteria bacterium]